MESVGDFAFKFDTPSPYNRFGFEFYTQSPCNRHLVSNKFICLDCGKLRFPLKFHTFAEDGKKYLYHCLWCEQIVTEEQIKQFEHLLWCTNKQVKTFGDIYLHCCVCYY